MKVYAKKTAVWLAGAVAVALVLASCETGHADQDRIRGFPYQPYLTVSENNGNKFIELPVSSLAYAKSGDRAFPDFYVFLDRNMSDPLFLQAVAQFPQLAQVFDGQKVSGFDPEMLKRLREVLVYRPGSGGSIQAVLLGNLPVELTRAAMLISGKFTQRYLTLGTHKPAYAMENEENGLHIGLIADGCFVIQVDDKPVTNPAARAKNFTLLVQRAILLKEAKFDSVLSYMAEKRRAEKQVASATSGQPEVDENGDPITVPVIPAAVEDVGAQSFDTVLVNEVTRPALFAMAAFALPETSPASAARLRVEPETVKNSTEKRMHIELTLKIRDKGAANQVKAGLKLALASLASMAGMDSAFLETVKIDAVDDALLITGITMSEKHLTATFSDVMNQAGVLWSTTNLPAEATTETAQ